MAATLTISPSTVTPGASFTASGIAQRKGNASTSCRILVENIVKSTFSVGPSGTYSRQIVAPTGANRTVQVVLQQLGGNGKWQTTAPAQTLTIQSSVPAPQPTIPTVPLSLSGAPGNTTVALSWSAPTSNGGSALTGYPVYKNGALLTTTAAGTTTYTAIGLVNNTDYQFSVAAKNAIGTGPQTSPPITVRPVAPADTTAPVISNVAVTSITQNSAVVSWVTNEPATTQVEYGPVPNLGSVTAKVNTLVTGHVQALAGLTPGVTYRYRVWSADAANNTEWSEAGAPFTTSSIVVPPPPPPASAIYGPGISGDGLGNTRFQGGLRVQSCRFRAEQSSALTAFTFYYLGPPDPGYALGTGGTWKAEIFADDGGVHYPTGSPLATKTVAALGGSDADRVITFASPATLVAGRLYHLVFTLTDANPDANHFSTDHWFIRQVPTGALGGRINPRFPLTDWAHLYQDYPAGNWVTRDQYAPILDLAYANGQHQGQSYGEAQYGPNDVGEITGTSKMVRERFTVSGGNRQITGAGIRLLREYGTDPLTVRLEDNAGTLIDSFTIAASLIPTGPAPTGANNSDNDLGVNAKWQAGVFAAIRTLVNGTTYRLRLSTAAGSKYWAWTNRRLSESYPNYTAATAFQDGYAEVTTNGSTWSALGVDVNQYDLQFYLAGAVVSTMPTSNLPGWTLLFNDDFLTPVAEGAFPAAVATKWGAYPQGWTDTASRIGRAEWGTYSPEIVSFHDSMMDIRVHTVGAVHKVAAPYPKINNIPGPFEWTTGNDQLGGRYAVRFKIDSIVGYKTAWLLWPRSENWPQDGEIDFPEGDLPSTISAFMHRQDGVNGADQDGYYSNATYPQWHTAVIEWKPGISCEFFMDEVSIGKSTSRVPNTPMHWVLQTETALDGSVPADAAQGHALIDWVAVWSYAP